MQITWESQIGTDNDNFMNIISEDTGSDFAYEPSGAWSTAPVGVNEFSGATGQ